MKRRANTIRQQIVSGFTVIILSMIFLVAISLVCLSLIFSNFKIVSINRDNQNATQSAVSAHYQWLDSLSISIQTDAQFTGSLDHTTCSLGKWLQLVETENIDSQINMLLQQAMNPHQRIHTLASETLKVRDTNQNAAFTQYTTQIKPEADQVIALLASVSARYMAIADQATHNLERLMILSIVCSILLALGGLVFALVYANKLATRVSAPISAVAGWSQKLALGMDNLDLTVAGIDEQDESEVGVMMRSFRGMAQSIRDNVDVVKRVANGDMTAFVNIRSSKDSLGKNLYHLVQTNDLLFAQILEVARRVADSAEEIAQVSHSLANGAQVQANAVQQLSSTIDDTSVLIQSNTKKTHVAADISEKIKQDIQTNSENMNHLVGSVQEIRSASERISSVIKTIDSIAFQTNILALNAAVEAARAGEAGKGFAVVANEVRALALKSATAAEETKSLIEDAISKTVVGSRISTETSEMFHGMINDITRIMEIILEVADAADEQQKGITGIRSEIASISQAVTENAHISAQSAQASLAMNTEADQLKHAMTKFNLRQRQKGQAYIPPEKADDEEFIRIANENYRRAMEKGTFQHELI